MRNRHGIRKLCVPKWDRWDTVLKNQSQSDARVAEIMDLRPIKIFWDPEVIRQTDQKNIKVLLWFIFLGLMVLTVIAGLV